MNIENIIQKNMSDLIHDTKIASYRVCAEPSEAEIVGLIVSKYFKWNGIEIMEVMLSSLEDANFHELRKRLLKTYEEWETEVLEEEEIFKLFKRSKNGK